jgi:hypothetical protein
MYVNGEDYYFLTYSLILLLKELGCTRENKKFKDYRKIAFLVDFVSDRSLVSILKKSIEEKSPVRNQVDRQQLLNARENGYIRIKLLSRLLFSLERNDIIGISANKSKGSFDIWLKKDNVEKAFFDRSTFKLEKQNLVRFKSVVKGTSRLTIETLNQQLFGNNGIKYELPFN